MKGEEGILKDDNLFFLTVCFQTFLLGRTFLILLRFMVFYQVDANSDVKKRLQSNKREVS